MIKISSESANPGPAFQQAIDAGADYIASSGEARSLYEEQAQAAADKGIKILSCFDTEPPGGDAARLAELGVRATVRANRGTDIDAACGQLRTRRRSTAVDIT
jgi:hypothetical protein